MLKNVRTEGENHKADPSCTCLEGNVLFCRVLMGKTNNNSICNIPDSIIVFHFTVTLSRLELYFNMIEAFERREAPKCQPVL